MPTDNQFRGQIKVAARIIDYISSGLYRTPAACLKELINNSYDADAKHVEIFVKPDADPSLRTWDEFDFYSQTMLRVALNVPVPYFETWIPTKTNKLIDSFTATAKNLKFTVTYDGAELRKPIKFKVRDQNWEINVDWSYMYGESEGGVAPMVTWAMEFREASGNATPSALYRKNVARSLLNVARIDNGRLRGVCEYILLFSKGDLAHFNIDSIRETDSISSYWVKYPERFHP